MASEPIHIASDHHMDYQMIAHLVNGLRREQKSLAPFNSRLSMHTELRTLTFWRAIISECMASFLYVFIVCGAAAGAGIGASVSSVLLTTSLASGLAIAVLTHCFLHVSGAHINPAVTLACFVTRLISPLRMTMYIAAQLGGGIAGAALLYGVSLPGYQGNLQAAISHSSAVSSWERFGVEMILTFVVVFTYFVSTNSQRKLFNNSAAMIGAAYSACNFVSMPYLNPARSLGPSFVLNKWENHWIFWMGPMAGGAISGILYEIIFNSKKRRLHGKDSEESSSMNSEDDINYDLDIEKANAIQPKFHDGNFNTYRSAQGNGQKQMLQQNMCQTMYQSKVEREPIYGGTRSLYCRSPPLTRANLHRSQSVYTKSNVAINRESSGVIRAGPLVPAQSLYPLRVAPTSQQNTHLQNQNVQNQLQQRSESIYGIRSSMRQSTNTERTMTERIPERDREPAAFQPIYGARNNPTPNDTLNYESREEPVKYGRRPDSVYGMSNRRIQSAQSDDSSYGSYHGSSLTPPTRQSSQNGNFHPNGQMMNQQQTYGMLPIPNPPQHHSNPNQQNHHHHPAQQQKQQQQQQAANQNERKLSTSTNSSTQLQRSVEFSDYSQKITPGSGHQTPLPPPPLPNHQTHPQSTQQQQQQNYQMHPIRQN
ncbi:hypothetical protein ACKWTF_000455 [Chironomus riparius]